jgi:CRISPR system Cascade subunit CasD
MANILFLRLEGPLQAWGERSRWSVRDTAPEPTKSGLVGLLGCALGFADDERLRELSQEIALGVRCDRPGTLLVDYHTVVGGVLSAEGKVKVNATTREPETVVSQRYYLADASFLAAVQSDPGWIERLAEAVQAPVWPIYLGRRSCVPSRPIYAGVGDFENLEAALAALPCPQRRLAGPEVTLRGVIECPPGQGQLRRDAVELRSRRTFGPRYTRECLLTVATQQEVA